MISKSLDLCCTPCLERKISIALRKQYFYFLLTESFSPLASQGPAIFMTLGTNMIWQTVSGFKSLINPFVSHHLIPYSKTTSDVPSSDSCFYKDHWSKILHIWKTWKIITNKNQRPNFKMENNYATIICVLDPFSSQVLPLDIWQCLLLDVGRVQLRMDSYMQELCPHYFPEHLTF